MWWGKKWRKDILRQEKYPESRPMKSFTEESIYSIYSDQKEQTLLTNIKIWEWRRCDIKDIGEQWNQT